MNSGTLFSPEHIWVLDTSALVQFKTIIKINDQWNSFKRFEELVISGSLRMPKQVVKEATNVIHPDVPGAWAAGMRKKIKPPLEPEESIVSYIMREVGNVVDSEREEDDADPYVIALAKQLQDDGNKVSVVSNECVDYDPRISIETACGILNIPHIRPKQFLSSVKIHLTT